jgi:hypothetical protein
MNRIVLAAVAVLATAGLVVAATSWQEEMAPVKPTKFHEFLKQFEGEWVGDVEMMGTKSKGSETDRLAAGGLFLVTDYQGEMMGNKFSGHGIMGYDTLKKKYVGSWVDSMSTAIWTSEGSCDDAGKVFTSVMEGPDPTGKMMKMKMVSEITGKDSKRLTFFMTGEDGKEHSTGKIEYTRKK